MSSKIVIVPLCTIGLGLLAIGFTPPSAADSASSDSGMSNPQGTTLQAMPEGLEGFYVETANGWSMRGVELGGVAIIDEALVATGLHGKRVDDLTGATFSATLASDSVVAMRIVRAVPRRNPWHGPPPHPKARDYIIEYSSKGQWKPLCPADTHAATPVIGSFGHGPDGRLNGAYDPTPTRLMFSCRTGVAAKCLNWGYSPHDPKGARYFQACTRMARADYCGNGHSRTIDGTLIDYVDLGHPLPASLHPPPGYVPEAVWGPGGADAPSAAMCLSRERWQGIPFGPRSPCAELLPDPRDESTGDGKPRASCEDKTVEQWKAAGALFFNASLPLDRALTVWRDGKGHYLTTTHYPWHGPHADSPGPAGYPEFVSIEGVVLKWDIPLPNRIHLVPLMRYSKKAGPLTLTVTTTGRAPAGFGDAVLEGYVAAPDTPEELLPSTFRTLYLHSAENGRYVTTTEQEHPANSSFSSVRKIGYLPH